MGPGWFDAVVDASGGGDFLDLESAVAAGAKSIFVRSGTYTLSNTLDIGGFSRIEGENLGSVEIWYSGCSAMITGTGSNQIRNLTLQKVSSCNSYAIQFFSTGNVVEDVEIVSGGFGIRTDVNCHISRMTITANVNGMFLGTGCSVDASVIATSWGNVIDATGASGSSITNNTLSVTANGTGISGTESLHVAGNTIAGLDIGVGRGIDVEGGSRVQGNHVTGFKDGIVADGRNIGTTVTGNTVDSPGQKGLDLDGGSSSDTSGLAATGNTILDPGTIGVAMQFYGLNVSANSVIGAGGACYSVTSSWLENSAISGNRALDCGGSAFDLTQMTSTSVTGNSSVNAGATAFVLSWADRSTVSGNTAYQGNVTFALLNNLELMLVGNHGTKSGSLCSSCREAGNSWN